MWMRMKGNRRTECPSLLSCWPLSFALSFSFSRRSRCSGSFQTPDNFPATVSPEDPLHAHQDAHRAPSTHAMAHRPLPESRHRVFFVPRLSGFFSLRPSASLSSVSRVLVCLLTSLFLSKRKFIFAAAVHLPPEGSTRPVLSESYPSRWLQKKKSRSISRFPAPTALDTLL